MRQQLSPWQRQLHRDRLLTALVLFAGIPAIALILGAVLWAAWHSSLGSP